MKAIITKIVPGTENKPTRIRASAEGVKSIIYSKDGIENELEAFGVRVIDENIQRHAALKFRDANNWTHVGGNPEAPIQNLATGQLPNGDWVHCFIPMEVPKIVEPPKPRVFTVVSVSSNANSFGYKGVLVLTEDGTGFECLYSFGNEPKRGDKIPEKDLPTYCRRDLPKTTPENAVKILKGI